ncbi:cupredoxin domain-containing protein [Streptomyces gamaensis]|uniref:Cupredoxin domain-containing protein n=1 Tax=Streptomyces gamaensis TaxID=1763542 RepID=A0ABW0YWU7_9ACTN
MPRSSVRTSLRAFCVLASALALGGLAAGPGAAASRSAAEVTVFMMNDQFVPKQVQIHPGDSVTWVNEDNVDHTTTSDAQSAQQWDVLVHPGQRTPPILFPNAGSFPYHCNFHPLMTGTVIVQ